MQLLQVHSIYASSPIAEMFAEVVKDWVTIMHARCSPNGSMMERERERVRRRESWC
jgi:hypothetical protein